MKINEQFASKLPELKGTLDEDVKEQRIRELEEKFETNLPEDYREILLAFGGQYLDTGICECVDETPFGVKQQ